MKKRILSLLLAGTMTVGLLAGCSSKGKSKTNSDGATVITIWSPTDEPAIEQWWKDKIAEFNKENKGEIEITREAIVRSGSYAYEDKVNAALTSNDLPDILYVDGPNIANYAANGVILPIDDYFSDDDLSDFVESIQVQGTYDDKLYALGATESSVALYYNKDMFDAAGIQAPEKMEDAWTWSEYKEIAKKLTKDGIAGTTVIMDKGEGIPYALEPFWVSNGTDFTSKDGSKAEGYLNSKEGIEAAEFLNSLIQEGIANIDPIEREFHNGKAAMMLGGSWDIATLENEFPDLNFGVTYYPVSDKTRKNVSPTGDWAATITKNADADKAGKAMQFLMNEENVTTYAKAISKMPTRTSSYEVLTEYDEYPRSIMKEQSMNTGSPRPRTPSYTVLSPGISQAMMNIFTGSDVKKELDQVVKDFEADYNKNYNK